MFCMYIICQACYKSREGKKILTILISLVEYCKLTLNFPRSRMKYYIVYTINLIQLIIEHTGY